MAPKTIFLYKQVVFHVHHDCFRESTKKELTTTFVLFTTLSRRFKLALPNTLSLSLSPWLEAYSTCRALKTSTLVYPKCGHDQPRIPQGFLTSWLPGAVTWWDPSGQACEATLTSIRRRPHPHPHLTSTSSFNVRQNIPFLFLSTKLAGVFPSP